MNAEDRALAKRLDNQLKRLASGNDRFPAVASDSTRDSFVAQVMDSHRRLRMLDLISTRTPSPQRADPTNALFHPWYAAVTKAALGHRDEAFWLLFLGIHFGRHRHGRWRYVSALYGRLGQGALWDWQAVSSDPNAFRDWLDANIETFRQIDSGFGNHRKYESLDARSTSGTGEVVATYVDWVSAVGNHDALFDSTRTSPYDTPEAVFERLYRSMNAIARFGRTARFDYLSTAGRLGLLDVRPGSPFLTNATGPLTGARLMFIPTERPADLDKRVVEFAQALGIGMDTMEDALCNWQKSPTDFIRFRG